MVAHFTNNKEGWTTEQKVYKDIGATTLVADTTTGYDSVGNITSILAVDHTTATIDQFQYTLDSADRLTSETATQNGATTTTTYTNDAAGQLTTAGTLSY